MYIAYELILHNPDSNYPTLENCLFGAVKLKKDTDIDENKYFGYGIGFCRKALFFHILPEVLVEMLYFLE